MGGRGSSSATSLMESEAYFTAHRPGSPIDYPDYTPTIDRLFSTGVIPKDSLEHPEWYFMEAREPEAREVVRILKSVQGRPDAEVTVYRGSPKGELNQGDWITLSRKYAESYAGDSPYASRTGKAKVYRYTAKASEISFDGDSLYEFGYWGKRKVAK